MHQCQIKISETEFGVKSKVQFSLVAQPCLTLWPHGLQATLTLTNSWSLLKLMSIKLMMPTSHFIFCYALLLLPSIFPSIRVFSNKSALHIRWPVCSSFSISPSNEYSGLISFSIDWFDSLMNSYQ